MRLAPDVDLDEVLSDPGRWSTHPRVVALPGREMVVYEAVDYEGDRDSWTIERGFTTDWASVPRLLWIFAPPTGRYSRAALLHDWLYVHKPAGVSRLDADKLFRRVMREDGVGIVLRSLMYCGVRVGGWSYWRKGQR